MSYKHTAGINHLAYTSFGISAGISLLTLLIPTPNGYASGPFHSLCCILAFMIAEYIGAALLFFVELREFTEQLQRAYRLFVAGFLLLAIGYTQLPLIPLLNGEDTPWVMYGGIAIPFFAGVACVYLSIRGFAKLFQVRSIFMSLWATAAIVLAVSTLSMLVPNGAPNIPVAQTVLQASKFTNTIPLVLVVASCVLCYKARQRAGSAYIPALAWLFLCLVVDAASGIGGFIVRFIQPGNNPLFINGLVYSAYVVNSVILLKAAVEFNKIKYGRDTLLPPDEQTFFGKPFAPQSHEKSVADVITYLAGFASDARAIDPILDDMRIMTATRDPGPFSEQEQIRLAHVYIGLARYLADEDPVRRYTQDELRAILQTRFATVLGQNKAFAASTHTNLPNAS